MYTVHARTYWNTRIGTGIVRSEPFLLSPRLTMLPYNAVLARDRQNLPVVLCATTWEKLSAAGTEDPEHCLLDYA